jgi:L-fuconolactonase
MNEPVTKKPSAFESVRPEWLALRHEETLEPDLFIIDAHHHLWARPECPYLLPDFLADIRNSGHAVQATVFVECRANYRRDGDRTLRSLGETEFAVAEGEKSKALHVSAQICAGIVAYMDLQAGGKSVEQLLDAHVVAGRGRLRGIRNMSAWLSEAIVATRSTGPPQGLLLTKAFREGFAHLAPRGLTFDAWMFHTQLSELRDLADAFGGTTIILNHVGGPIGVGRFGDHPRQVFDEWSLAMRELASCSNVYVKLGGLGMPHCGFGFHEQPVPPSSKELADAWRPLFDACLREFGPDRCMFESNFPVDKASFAYETVWNAFKRLTTGYSTAERNKLFAKTAAKVYRLDLQDLTHP